MLPPVLLPGADPGSAAGYGGGADAGARDLRANLAARREDFAVRQQVHRRAGHGLRGRVNLVAAQDLPAVRGVRRRAKAGRGRAPDVGRAVVERHRDREVEHRAGRTDVVRGPDAPRLRLRRHSRTSRSRSPLPRGCSMPARRPTKRCSRPSFRSRSTWECPVGCSTTPSCSVQPRERRTHNRATEGVKTMIAFRDGRLHRFARQHGLSRRPNPASSPPCRTNSIVGESPFASSRVCRRFVTRSQRSR